MKKASTPTGDSSTATDGTPKRGRGRPRKNTPPVVQGTPPGNSSSAQTVKTVTPPNSPGKPSNRTAPKPLTEKQKAARERFKQQFSGSKGHGKAGATKKDDNPKVGGTSTDDDGPSIFSGCGFFSE